MDADPPTSVDPPRRIAITGATGNVGVALLTRLLDSDSVDEIVGLARRAPDRTDDRLRWREVDLLDPESARPSLREVFSAVDAVVHLAWAFQPTHDPVTTWRINAVGSRLVVDTAAAAELAVFVHQSSVGAYSPGPLDGARVDEGWPTDSLPTAGYGREKAYVERVVDTLEASRPEMRVVRFRPGFIFHPRAADEQRQIFAGWLLPQKLVADRRLPVLPWPGDLRFQTLHADDMAEAIRLAITRPVRGAFNLAAEPVVGAEEMAEVLDAARTFHLPVTLVRAGVAAGWRSRVVPTEPALLDLVTAIPLLDTTRARTELGWEPRHSSLDALRALVEGWSTDVEGPTPALSDPIG